MSTTADKLNYLNGTKDAIKQAIIDKGVTVDDSTTFREYADKIGDISGGGGGDPIFTSIDDPSSVTITSVIGVNESKWLLKFIKEVNLNLIKFDVLDETESMFNGFSSLVSLDLSSIDTSKSINMGSMFLNCAALTSLDLSNFDVSKVKGDYWKGFGGMFSECLKLSYIKWPPVFFPNNGDVGFYQMFYYCSSLTTLDLSSFNTSNVTNMSSMFNYCSSLTTLDLSSFNTSNVTSMSSMFSFCSSLTNVTWGNNWASNNSINTFFVNDSPLSHESCLDLFNKLATKSSSATLTLSSTTKGYMSEEEIAIATNKGWTVA